MARRRSATFTETELRIMEVLWRRGPATVAEVAAALPPPPVAYNTVLTMLRILEQKGYAAHDEAGRAYVYRPLIERDEAANSAVGQLLKRFFSGNGGALALRLIEDREPSREELDRLKKLIESYEDKT